MLRGAVALLVVVAGCSRTDLSRGRALGVDGQGGAAAGPGSSGPGAAGGRGGHGGDGDTGGQGGDPPCSVLTLHEPVLTLAGGEMHHQRQPVLTASSGDANVVTVVTEWMVVESPVDPPAELRHTSMSPWDAWPSDGTIEPSYLADLDRGATFAATRSGDERFAVLAGDGDDPSPPDGVHAHLALTPGSGMQSATSIPIDEFADLAHFIAASPSAFLVGFNKQLLHEQTYMGIAASADGTTTYLGPFHVACDPDGPSADAEAVGETWLIAASSGADLATDSCFTSLVGPADRIHIAGVDGSGELSAGETVFTQSPVTRVRTAAHRDGMWVAWTEAGIDAVAPIHAVRVDTAGTVVTAVIDLAMPLQHAAQTGSIAADRLGTRLAVAWVDDPAGNPPDVAVAVHDGETLVAEALYQPEGGVFGAVSVLGSPAGDAVLVAWSELVGSESRVRLARFDCSP
jgi:hypothetical protein